jgi:two-component system, sensor histidine kinase PdtaS
MATIGPPSEVLQGLARGLIDAAQQPVLLFDADLRVVGASRSFCVGFSLPGDEVEGRILSELGQGEWDFPPLQLLLENARLGGPELGDYETGLIRPGVPARRLLINVQNVVYGDDNDTLILLTAKDVTDARRAEQTNAALLHEKDGLLRERAVMLQEMQHRIANSLQIIASVLLLKARAVESEETKRHLRDAHDRVVSIAAVQQHLQQNLGDVDVGPYLTKLCGSLGSSMIRESRPLDLEVRTDNAVVSAREAVSLGLVVTELVINALKHAFPDDRAGRIIVGYELAPWGWTLSVADDGVGIPAQSANGGLGTTIVQALARQLDADVAVTRTSPGATIALIHRASLAA